MIHFDRFCAALGFLVLLTALVVGVGAALGTPATWSCTHVTYTEFETVTRAGICEAF